MKKVKNYFYRENGLHHIRGECGKDCAILKFSLCSGLFPINICKHVDKKKSGWEPSSVSPGTMIESATTYCKKLKEITK
jgi:hypothetical protein